MPHNDRADRLRYGEMYRQSPDGHARRCAYSKEYLQRPGVRERHRRYNKAYRQRPGAKKQYRIYQSDYRQRPDAKVRLRLIKKKYRQSPKAKKTAQRYHQRPEIKARYHAHYLSSSYNAHRRLPEVKNRKRLYGKKYFQRSEIKARMNQYKKKYRQTPKGRLVFASIEAKRLAKGFIPLCPNGWSCSVDYHHVSPSHAYVVPLPRNIHRAVGGNSPFHFAFNASMICRLYGLGVLK